MDRATVTKPIAVKANWDTRLEMRLTEPNAARVLNTLTLFRLARHEQSTLSRASLERWITDALAAKRLIKVVRGLYLNRMTTPPAELTEAAGWLRPGAIVSLQTVLGDCGAWNNFTDAATAVVPFSFDAVRPSLGTRSTQAGQFHFRGIPEAVLLAGREADRLADVYGYLRATPEAALLHWIYLANSPRSNLSAPPLDIDLDDLNLPRLQRLAKAMQLEDALNKWLEVKHAYDESPSVAEQTWIP
ncbi:hypothetical protein ACG33_01181 [Steroidobacter denitrificans]|uniref:Uncharacterized protein n=1 Tax=Steroidobacter denitrificans TaxID=465721 RepID=A0A127F855_STEDE|nr:hypothetical protein [Steroidobacter denitrificans]AMN45740.1 hypothetical protein ACG33_01181 [Steroidobacter denitrificans]